MTNKIIYSAVKSKFKKLLVEEHIPVPRKFYDNLLKLCSKLCVYEEEEKKIRPQIIISYNLNEALLQVPNHISIPFKEGKRDGADLEKITKAMIPFCNNGWIVYIDIKVTCIEYGLTRAFNGPKGLSVTEVIFTNNGSEDLLDFGLVELTVINNYELRVFGVRKHSITIDFRLTQHPETNVDFEKISQDINSGHTDTSERIILQDIFTKIMQLTTTRVHGTICLVVRNDYSIPNEFLSDGIWPFQPIDLTERALNVHTINDCISAETFYGLSGLLLEMMNVDGITIIDNLGRIRGFNCFISKTNIINVKRIDGGGARRRAAQALIDKEDPNFLGVYFQSQDGYAFYERIGAM